MHPGGSDVVGRIGTTDENADAGVKQSLDPIQVTDYFSAIIKCARGGDKRPHLPADGRWRLLPDFFPVFESRDKPPGVFGASADERP